MSFNPYKKEKKYIADAKKDGCRYLWGNYWLYADFDMLLSDMDTTEEDLYDCEEIERGDETTLLIVKHCENDWEIRESCDNPKLLSEDLYLFSAY